MVSDLKRGILGQTRARGRERPVTRQRDIDREGLAAIYEEYYQPIYCYVYRQVSDVETARDLSAEVFHRLLRTAQKGNGPDRHPKGWLYRTAHNLVVDHYRRQQHRQHLPLEEELAQGSDNPADTVERRSEAAQVRAALQELTPDQQQVIALKFLQDMSNQEVAEVLDKTVGSVKSLQHRALAALQRQLAAQKEGIAR
jgi:RNA polymerase sigma-70 factor (ECF subfamily)